MGGCVSRARSSHLAAFQFIFSGREPGTSLVVRGQDSVFLQRGTDLVPGPGRSRMPGDAAERICF